MAHITCRWNPKEKSTDDLPGPLAGLVAAQTVPEYLLEMPTYLTGMLPGDIGFDPFCLAALAQPTADSLQALSLIHI